MRPKTRCLEGLPQRINGRAASAAAKEYNQAILDGAIEWVAAHPDHAGFSSMKMPPPSPIVTILDGGSQMASRANTNKDRKPINRVRAGDVNMESLSEEPAGGTELAF